MNNRLYTDLTTKFSDLIFNEEEHRYFINRDGTLVNLPSVSSKVESHAPKFNENKKLRNGRTLLENSAYKASTNEGIEITPAQLKYRWYLHNKEACTLGTETHDFLEHYRGIETPRRPQEQAGINFIKSLAGKYAIEVRELRAYSLKYGYAGTMDLPLQIIGTSDLIIADYKTNADLFKSYDNLYAPFQFLESSPYNKYQLQLSYYQILLEEALRELGYNIIDRWLIHLKPDTTFRIFPTIDFTKELRVNLAQGKVAA